MSNLQVQSLTVNGTTYDIVDNTSGYMTGMTILSYGNSTWQDFIDAYTAKKVVYCRASSQSNPATGSQTRLAFMAYVNNAESPTEVEFQYYRSVSSKTESQQGDQVFIYTLTSSGSWSVITREASVKVAVGGDLNGSYSGGTYTISADIPDQNVISVDQKVTTGVNIADITINGVITELYAPQGGGSSGTITRVKTTAGAHTTIDVSSGSASFNIPTNTSHLVNDSGFVTSYTDEKLNVTSISNSTEYTLVTMPSSGSTPRTATGNLCHEFRIKTDGSTYSALYIGDNYRGQIKLGNKASSSLTYTTLKTSHTTDRTITLPNKDGTVALTSDIPTISYPVTSVNNKTGAVSLTASDVGALPSTTTIPSITLNGSSSTSPSFYAPTGAGTSGQYLKSNGSGAPSWANFPTIPSITLNGSNTTSPSFYAPTSVGTSGYVLKSNGNGAPTWTSAVLTDTKNTAGSTNSSSKLYLIGATEQSANPQTYSNSELYFSNGLNSTVNGVDNKFTEMYQTTSTIGFRVSDEATFGYGIEANTSEIRMAASQTSSGYVAVDDNGVWITGLVTPSADYDAANKKYVDDVGSSILEITHIVASGGTSANNTWNYRKWSDGTLECWARFYTSSMNITSGTGQLKYAAFSISNPNYPIAFVGAYPTVQVSGNVTNGNGWAVMDNKTYSLTGIGTIYIYAPVNVTSAGVTVNVYAIGKWE